MGHTGLYGVHTLRGLPNGQAVAFPVGYASMKFHGCVKLCRCVERHLDGRLRLFEPFFHIPSLVSLGLTRLITLFMDLRSAGLQRFSGVRNKGQNLVIHLDGTKGVPGLVRRLRSHRRHCFALEPAVGIEQARGKLDSRKTGVNPLGVRARRRAVDQRVNSRHLFCPADIHPFDLRMRMGTSEDGPIEHVGKQEVRGIDRAPADPLIGVHTGHGLADHVRLVPRLGVLAGFRRLRDSQSLGVVQFFIFLFHDCPRCPFRVLEAL